MKVVISCHVRWFNAEAYYAYNLAFLLQKEGVQVTVLTQPNSPLAKRLETNKIGEVVTMDFLSSAPSAIIKSLKIYQDVLRRTEPDFITVHRSESFFFNTIAVRSMKSKPCILRFRGDPRTPSRSFFNRLLYKQGCDTLIVSGQILKYSLMEALAIPEEKIKVVYAPIDIERFSPKENTEEMKINWNFDPQKLTVGVVGRIGEVKGHKYFLETVEALPPEFDDVAFYIAYHEEHEEVEELKADVAKRGLSDRITFIGFTEHIEQLIAATDIGIISSIGSEANCRVALEFMASGKPLVATTVGVIPEVITDNETGFLVPPRKPDESANKLIQLLKNKDLRIKMGENGRKNAIKRFSQEVFFQKIKTIINENCKKNISF